MKILSGSILDQIEKAEKFILSNIKKAARIVMFERQEVWEYPPKAIREALVNAICHRDYFAPGNTQISIYDNRIDIWNPGELPEPLTHSMLKKKHASIPRNPLIADAFFLIKNIEQWGEGTNKIVDWCKNHGLQEPDFEESSGNFILKIYAPEDILSLIPDQDRTNLKELGLNERQIEALRSMVNQDLKMTVKKYEDMFDVSNSTAKRDIKKLLQSKLIYKTGNKKRACYFAK